jgi:hypothetical protein
VETIHLQDVGLLTEFLIKRNKRLTKPVILSVRSAYTSRDSLGRGEPSPSIVNGTLAKYHKFQVHSSTLHLTGLGAMPDTQEWCKGRKFAVFGIYPTCLGH